MLLLILSLLISPAFLTACPFCDGGVAKTHQVFYEDEYVLGIYPHKPMHEYHVLVLPKRHVERFEDLDDQEVLAVHHLIQKVQEKIFALAGLNDYFLLQKNGKSAGQTVPHIHIHCIPVDEGTWTTTLLWRFFTEFLRSPLAMNHLEEKTHSLSEKIAE